MDGLIENSFPSPLTTALNQMKQTISLLITASIFASSASASAALVAYVNPTNTNPDSYWPDLPGAKNLGGSTNFDFNDSRQGFYLTSNLNGTNARGVIYYGTALGQTTSSWTLQIAATITGQIDRVSFGSLIGPNSTWISNPNIGSLETEFESNLSITVAETMFIAFRRVNTLTGETNYGWAELKTVPLRDDGHEDSWANFGLSSAGIKFTQNVYDNGGLSIYAGQYLTIPEPSPVLFSLLGLFMLTRRRRA